MEQNTKEKQFTSLIEEYKRVIYKICYMYATDGDNFKDLYQDVVINLWKGFEGYVYPSTASSNAGANILPWIPSTGWKQRTVKRPDA